jgi:hypothetical protein
MKVSTAIVLAWIVPFLVAPAPAAQYQVYRHPTLDFRFEAPPGWQQVNHPEDDLIYEVVDSGTGIHVMMWYTETEQDALRYLKKMAGMKDLRLDRQPQPQRIGQLDGWVLRVPGNIAGTAVRTVLAVVPCGMSPARPDENALYVVQIWCSAERAAEHERTMDEILASVVVRDTD